MSINVSNLEKVISEKMNSASTEKELLEYSKIIEKLKTGNVQVVSTFGDLPVSSEHIGELYYVSDEKLVYWSTGTEWTTLHTFIYNIYGWGSNINGEIGDGTTSSKCSPVQEITSSTDWCQVSNVFHSLGLKTSGTLWGWGGNDAGKIGDNTNNDRCSPVQEVTSSANWCHVSAGRFHSLALKTSGQIWGWGNNIAGIIGDGTTIARSSPVQEVSSSTDWCQVDSGCNHSLALKETGTVWAWGDNYNGRIGDGTTIDKSSPVQEVTSSTNWCQISGGSTHSLALKTSGTLWAWGRNSIGRIGDGTTIDRSSPVQEVTSSTNWCQVSSGGIHSLALKTSGTLWAWGYNNNGQIGDGTTICRSSPVQEVSSSTDWCQVSGGFHSLALKTSGTLWGWGRNNAQLGDGTTINKSSPVQEVSSSTNWCQVSGGGGHSLAIKQVV